MSEKVKILARVNRLFMSYGIKSVTMDDVARELGISKKTLYKHFQNKKDLVKQTTLFHFETEKEKMFEIQDDSANAIDEMIKLAEHVSRQLSGINPSITYDTQKYYPESWKIFLDYKINFVFSCIRANLSKGIEQGYYRASMNPDIIARLYIGKVEVMFDNVLFPIGEFSLATIYYEFIQYHLRGIASPKGLEYLDKIKPYKNA